MVRLFYYSLVEPTPLIKLADKIRHLVTQEKVMKSYIYINRHKVKKNKKESKDEPVIAVKTYKGTEYTKKVTFSDGSQLKQDFINPICSGATIWLESERENIILG